MRTGTSFLRIETGRYERQPSENGSWENLPVEKRICRVCKTEKVEDELHFLLKCPAYTQARIILRHNLEKQGIIYMENNEMLKKLLTEKNILGITADFLQYAIDIRKKSENK